MLVGEFRASKWGRISLERPPQPAAQDGGLTEDAPAPEKEEADAPQE